MRAALFVSALFAVSMTTGAALAERSAGVTRTHEVRQRDVRDVRARDARPDVRVAKPAAAKETRLAPKGDLVAKKAAEARRCSETGTDCPNKGAKNARVKEAQKDRGDKHAQGAAQRQRMKDAVAKVWRSLCEKRASSCADAL